MRWVTDPRNVAIDGSQRLQVYIVVLYVLIVSHGVVKCSRGEFVGISPPQNKLDSGIWCFFVFAQSGLLGTKRSTKCSCLNDGYVFFHFC
jgi:hypothetical protein